MNDAPQRARRPRPNRSKPNRSERHPLKPGLAARQAATKLLGAIVDARTAMDGLTDDAHGHPAYLALEGRDRALVRAILLTALRHRTQIADVFSHRLERPLPKNARSLEHHLHVGAAQVLFLDVPASAAVDLAAEAVGNDPRTRRFQPLANALLRRIGRERPKIVGWLRKNPPRPAPWLDAAIEAAYGPERAEAIRAAHATEAPLDLTVRGDPGAMAETLNATVLPTGTLRIGTYEGSVTDLPGFAEGTWWVQDAASALPVKLLGDLSGTAALDLCAAPGGKTAQMAAAGARVTAVEINSNRMRRLQGNLERLGLEAQTVVGDALKLTDGEIGGPFDAVLLDAPCSSTGTIRRHPDVAWTKESDDVATLAALQTALLARAASLVASGGTLVFSTCSLLPDEGEAVAAAFLTAHPQFALAPVAWSELGSDEAALAPMVTPEGTLRTAPDLLPADTPRMSGLDGFFAARFRRSA